MRKMYFDTFKNTNEQYAKRETAETKVLELKRLQKLVMTFPLETMSNVILSEIMLHLEKAVESLQKPVPDFEVAEAFVDKANAILNEEALN